MAGAPNRPALGPVPDPGDTLLHGEFVALKMHPYGSNAVFDAVLEGPAGRVRAIYKPRKGEAPLWDFPDGTLYRREVATYLVSRGIGWDLVPPTVVREGPHGVGSVQLYVDHDPEVHFFSLREARQADFARIAAFDVLTNNADRKGGHCLLGGDGRIWAIDNGLTFHMVYKLRTVIWDFAGQRMGPEILRGLETLVSQLESVGDLAGRLGALLDRREIAALRERLDDVLENPVFPHPGPGRSVPWPPV